MNCFVLSDSDDPRNSQASLFPVVKTYSQVRNRRGVGIEGWRKCPNLTNGEFRIVMAIVKKENF